jgi:hypothetical protein
MSQGRWLTCLWPGLAELWLVGCWSGLLQAVGFALLLNGALATTLVWTELLSAETRLAAWAAVALLWLMGAWSAWRFTLNRREPDGDLFSSALSEYLQGNWFAAEALLERLVKNDPRDIEARLLWATLLRRTGRLQEARTALDRLARSPGTEKWDLEIRREKVLMDQMPAIEPTPAEEVKTDHDAAQAADETINTSRAA